MTPATIILSFLAAGDPSVADLEAQILKQRRSITRGHVEVEIKVWEYKGTDRTLKYHRDTEVWFDGAKIRGDVVQPVGRDKSPGASQARHVDCYSNDWYIKWTDNPRQTIMAAVTDRTRIPKGKGVEVPNPRLLGLVPVGFADLVNDYHLESYLSRGGRSNLTIRRDVRAGLDCWLVQYALDSVNVSWWSCPQYGGEIVEMELSYPLGEKPFRENLSLVLSKNATLNAWFPRRLSYQRILAGVLQEEEEMDVKVCDFNVPIDPVLFSFAGLGLPVGLPVHHHGRPPPADHLVWDGHDLVEPTDDRSPFRDHEERRSVSVRWLPGAAGIVLVIFFGYFAFRYIRR